MSKENLWTEDAKRIFDKNKSNGEFMLGIGLYWGEGSKYGSAFELTNSDPGILKCWIKWHKKFLPDLSLRYTIFAHEDIDKDECIKYWKATLLIDDVIKFYRAIPKSSTGKRKGKLPNGTFRIATKKGAKESRHKMLIWMSILTK